MMECRRGLAMGSPAGVIPTGITALAIGWRVVGWAVGNSGDAVYHIPTPPLTLPRGCWGGQRGAMEIWKTASPGYRWHCGFRGMLRGIRRLTPIWAGCRVQAWLGWRRRKLVCGRGYWLGRGLRGCCCCGGGIGHGPPLPQSSQGSDRGSDEP